MGFWEGLRAMFGLSKNIGVSEDISGYLIFPLKLKKKSVTLNRKLMVPKDFMLAFVSEGKILDVFPAGEHMLTAVTMPKASSRFKLYKPDKDGNPVESFPCEAYYVSLLPQANQEFELQRKVRYKTAVDGRYWVRPKGEISFVVKDATLFLANILENTPKIKVSKVDKAMNEFFQEPIYRALKKKNYTFSSFRENVQELEESILEPLNLNSLKKGVEVFRVDIESVSACKRILKKEEADKLAEQEKMLAQQRRELEENSSIFKAIQQSEDSQKQSLEILNQIVQNDTTESNDGWQGLESFSKGNINLKEIGSQEEYEQIRTQFHSGSQTSQCSSSTESATNAKDSNVQTGTAKWGGINEVNESVKTNRHYVDLDQ